MNDQKKETKHAKVKRHLLQQGHITSWDAIRLYRATRLAAIIHNLKKRDGFIIKSEICYTRDGDRYAKYSYIARSNS